jgi:hypothetical protein
MHVRQHADGANLEPRPIARRHLGEIRAHLQALFAAGADDDHVHFALRASGDRNLQVFPVVDLGGAEPRDDVAGTNAGALGR